MKKARLVVPILAVCVAGGLMVAGAVSLWNGLFRRGVRGIAP